MQHEVKFYQNLEYINSYLSETKFDNILSHDEASLCDGLLTEQETTDAVINMKLNKSPGLSGFSIEFLSNFLGKIKLLVINS